MDERLFNGSTRMFSNSELVYPFTKIPPWRMSYSIDPPSFGFLLTKPMTDRLLIFGKSRSLSKTRDSNVCPSKSLYDEYELDRTAFKKSIGLDDVSSAASRRVRRCVISIVIFRNWLISDRAVTKHSCRLVK